MSTFFTLSGFLITALLLIEHGNADRVDLRSFWARRARRLLPASLVAILAIATATAFLGDANQLHRLPADTFAALTYVANWRFILAGDQYGAGFEGQSPLLHFWSLAIEEQFYLVFPLLCAGAFALQRRWRLAVPAVFGAGVLASLAAGAIGSTRGASVSTLYFRTDVRAGELLVGALVAVWWVPRRGRLSPILGRAIQVLGVGLVVVMLGLIATAQFTDLFWYRGGLLAYSLVTCGVILAAVEARGPVRAFLSWGPLVAIGTVSYGAYLAHWPVFIWLRSQSSMPGAARLVAGTTLSLLIAVVSSRIVERPIRERRWDSGPSLYAAGATLAVSALVVATVAAPNWGRARDEVPLADARTQLEKNLQEAAAAPGDAPTVAVFGDSTGLVMGLGLSQWDDTHDTVRAGVGWAGLGCSILSPTEFREAGEVHDTPKLCDGWLSEWQRSGQADISLVMFGPWEVAELRPPGAADFAVVGDPALDAAMEANMTKGIAALVPHSRVVVMTTSPYIERGRLNGKSPSVANPESDHARMDRLNLIIRKVAAKFPKVALIDLAGYLEERGDDRRMRPDGVHLTVETAAELTDLMAPTLASLAPVGDRTIPPGTPMLPLIKRPTA